MRLNRSKLKEKLNEILKAVFPILAVVLLLCFTIAPISPGILMLFLIGAALLIVGMLLFSFGVDLSMTQMGERVGTTMTKTRKVFLMAALSFVMGFIITVSEPDLQVLARQVPSIPDTVIILAVAAGVGVFLMIALLRMLFGIALSHLLIILYLLAFALAMLTPADFLAVAFDSGGVTTGPMTVPFIMALGVGISAIRSDERAADDSFGLVSLCSVGPVMAVLLLGMICRPKQTESVWESIPVAHTTVELWRLFSSEFPTYLKEMAVSLLPIALFFAAFELVTRDVGKKALIKIGIGLGYTYVGLVLFLTGVNVGFMPAGNYLGQIIAGLPYSWVIIPIGMVIGYFIVLAEPAVFVMTRQVEEMTSGAIPARAMGLSLSIGVSISVGIAMLRVLTGISVMWFLTPGYALALALSFFVPKLFTAIAFDSGGVASGPMTAAFLLPFAMGACRVTGGNMITDAFGVVAMVAMTPLITIQLMGLVFRLKERNLHRDAARRRTAAPEAFGDMEIIEL